MLSLDEAKRIVHGPSLANRDQLFVLLAIEPTGPLAVQEIKHRCTAVGLPRLARMNISDILCSSSGSVARTLDGWELQQSGVLRVQELAHAAHVNLVVTHSSRSLRGHADKVTDPLTKSFVMEAITCFEANQYRAAVVFFLGGCCSATTQICFCEEVS
jgi:hypothetical protein